MLTAPIPDNDSLRLQELYKYEVLDTGSESEFDEITQLVANLCGAEIALISLVDENRQWFKSKVGLEANETPRDISFCGHAIMDDELFIIEDAKKDERFCDNPLVLNGPQVCFYAGMPLVTPNGFRIGTLCVIDSYARNLDEGQKSSLKLLAKHIVGLLELRFKNQRLKYIETQSSAIQRISKTGGWDLDVETNEVIWSEEVYHIYGLETGVSVNKIDGISYYAEDERERLSKLIKNSITNGVPFSSDFKFYDAQGNFKWVRSIGQPIFDKNKKVLRLVGTFQDISSIKDQQEQILEKEKLYKLIFENSEDAMMTLSLPNRNFQNGNTACLNLFGINSQEEFALLRPEDLSPMYQQDGQLSSEKAAKMIDIALAKGFHFFEWTHQKISKEKIECTVLLNKVKMDNVFLILATVRDITKEKRRNEILEIKSNLGAKFIEFSQNRKLFFDYLLDITLKLTESEYGFVGQILQDEKGRYLKTFALTDISWNEETKKIYQDTFNNGLEFRNLNTLFGQVIATGEPLISNDARNDPRAGGIPKGHPDLNSFLGLPIYHAEKFIGMIGVANNIYGYNTKLIDEMNGLLEAIGEMLSLLIISEELERQKKFAIHNAKLASIGELAAGIGHEINNPLTIISGQLSVLSKFLQKAENLPEDIHERIDKSFLALKRISKIVNGLRNFSRADEVKYKRINLNTALQETVDLIGEIFKKDQITLNMELDVSIPEISGSYGQLQQIFVNILTNAKDALSNTIDKKIVIKTHVENNEVVVEFSDNGIGISNDMKQKIFEPFFTTKDINKGTGIGLAIVHSLVIEHNGRIHLDTEIDLGTTFKFYFPFSDAENIKKIEKTEVSEIEIPKVKGHALIVDDEDTILEILEMYLVDIGMSVSKVSNGQEAFDYLHEKISKVDLIISDIKMPIMDGLSFFNKARENNLLENIKFLFMTGGVNTNTNFEKTIKKADGLILKPFSEKEIFKKIAMLNVK